METLLCPGHSHIKHTPLFLQILLCQSFFIRYISLIYIQNIHMAVFQSLHAVKRGHSDPRIFPEGLLFLFSQFLSIPLDLIEPFLDRSAVPGEEIASYELERMRDMDAYIDIRATTNISMWHNVSDEAQKRYRQYYWGPQ